jgi:uncharacterized damage-inducible protein DinB
MNAQDDPVLDAWRINNRVTTLLVEAIPPALWGAAVPGSPRRTIRSIAAHLHNTRGLWLRSLAVGASLAIPARVDASDVTPHALAKALDGSGQQVLLMIQAGLRNGGQFPQVPTAFIYGAMPRNVVLFVGYALSHEGHHRGQILLSARALRQKLPPEVTAALWQWSSRLKETRSKSVR